MSHSQRPMLIFSPSVKTLTLRQLIKLDDWLEKLDLGSIAIEGVRMLPFIDLYRNCRSLTLSHHLSSHSLSFSLCHSLSHMANLSLSLSLSLAHSQPLSLSVSLSHSHLTFLKRPGHAMEVLSLWTWDWRCISSKSPSIKLNPGTAVVAKWLSAPLAIKRPWVWIRSRLFLHLHFLVVFSLNKGHCSLPKFPCLPESYCCCFGHFLDKCSALHTTWPSPERTVVDKIIKTWTGSFLQKSCRTAELKSCV